MSTIESEPTPAADVEVSAPATAAGTEASSSALATAIERSAGAHTLEKLLGEIPDEDLRAKLREAYARTNPKRFGLVYEDHEPDAVALPAGTPIRPGDLVRREAGGKVEQQLFQVETTGRRGLSIRPVLGTPGAGELGESIPVEDASMLRVVKAWGAPVYPGLTRIGDPVGKCAPRAPEHMLIQGENLHALQALCYTHAGKVDLIYIDPPYNTGNKTWIYNDRYVAEKDAFRHSKWLAFMEHRLTVARDLLKDTGVIVVAIGDNEHHRLRMLMDEIFGADCFLGDVHWTGARNNNARFISAGTDHMLVYARDVGSLLGTEAMWREPKPGCNDVVEAGQRCWAESGYEADEASKMLRAWWKALPKGHPARTDSGLAQYNRVDDVRPGSVFRGSDLSNPDPMWVNRYDLLHPTTGKPVPVPTHGWRYTRESMNAKLVEGRILFGKDETSSAQYKRYLDDVGSIVPVATFVSDRAAGSKHIEFLLGDKRFPNPKDHTVLMKWIRMIAPSDGVILDFFGGSGSTMEAVIRLNAEDGGTRQAILVTNNELSAADDAKLRKAGHVPGDEPYEALGVCRHVTIPRLTSVVTGRRPDGTEHKHGAVDGARFSAWKLDYLDPVSVEMGAQFAAIAPLLWAESGCLGPVIEDEPFTWEVTDHYGVLTSAADLRVFVDAVTAKSDTYPFTAWIVADTDAQWNAAARALPPQVNARRLWSHYVRSFEINVPGRAR